MLDDYETQAEGPKRQCKPDYENMIKRAKEKLIKTDNFLTAIFDYHGNVHVRNKIAELVGELYSQKIEIESSIERMIKEQEAS